MSLQMLCVSLWVRGTLRGSAHCQCPPSLPGTFQTFAGDKKKKGLDGIRIDPDVSTNFTKRFPKCLKAKQNQVTETTESSALQTAIYGASWQFADLSW